MAGNTSSPSSQRRTRLRLRGAAAAPDRAFPPGVRTAERFRELREAIRTILMDGEAAHERTRPRDDDLGLYCAQDTTRPSRDLTPTDRASGRSRRRSERLGGQSHD